MFTKQTLQECRQASNPSRIQAAHQDASQTSGQAGSAKGGRAERGSSGGGINWGGDMCHNTDENIDNNKKAYIYIHIV